MIYPEAFESKLKFEKIREFIAEFCLSGLGKERVYEISYSERFDDVKIWLQQTGEMLRLELEGDEVPVSYVFDSRTPLKKIRVEGLFLDEHELFDLYRSLGTIKDIIRLINSKDVDAYPRLHGLASQVKVYPAVTDRIDKILNKQGLIKDNASPELFRIRKEIVEKQQAVSKRMLGLLKQARQEGLIDADVGISIRDGRAVIPVISSFKRKLPGIIHDESATGKTTYIEPAAIVELNNEIRELNYTERREIVKILIEISTFIRPYLEDILYSYEFLGTIDFVRAKARFARKINAILPEFGNTTNMRWIDARHPLLYLQNLALGKPVEPLNIEFSPDQRIILISGPNAGGKSVCLQTVGLLQYMWQCGLLVPVKEGSKMGFFNHILLDLGDEQSIENDLSTYSSHLLNMKTFLKYCDTKSLLLIDEFGTGTEPMLGGAIAESVLAQLNKQGVFGVITTHYTNLKHFASESKGIVNGAMLFDTHNIQPLFKLEIGQPGSSFAFEIARKIGLPEEILINAKEKLGEGHINFDKHLREIIRDKRYWENKRNSIKERERRLIDVTEKYEGQLEQITRERKDILQKAKEEAANLLSRSNREIENTIRTIKETQAEKEKTNLARKNLSNLRDEISSEKLVNSEIYEKLASKMQRIKERKEKRKEKGSKKIKEPEPEEKLAVKKDSLAEIIQGDMVLLEGQPIPGEVMEIKGREALVAFGNIVTKVKINRLKKISRNECKREVRQLNSVASGLAERIREKKLNFKPDIDIRGFRTDEAIDKVMVHIDEAVLCGEKRVRILHGKGNGILRKMIREFLSTLPFISNMADEHIQLGGTGITVVDLD